MCTVPELIPPIPDPELKLLDPIPESKQTPELLKALEIGYKVLEIYEVYDFNENEKKIRLSWLKLGYSTFYMIKEGILKILLLYHLDAK